MSHRASATRLMVALMAVGSLAAALKPARDWTRHPAIVEIDTKSAVYAVGDIHGDYDRLVTLLTAHGLIAADPPAPERAVWTGGSSILVCTGDILNKGDQALRVLALFQAIQKPAESAGGRIIVCMGNHEAETLGRPGVGKKAVGDFAAECQRQGIKLEEVAAGRDRLGVGDYLRSLPFACRVNDWFFAHAGNTHGRTLAQLRTDLQDGVDTRGFGADILLASDSLLEARLHPTQWWDRAGESAAQGQERLRAAATALGVKHLVVGHQPGELKFADGSVRKAGEMAQKFDGLLFLIDVGMSRGVGNSTGALLRVQSGQADALYPDRTIRHLWP